jgi:very-short-patch-repair endonuclease
MRKKIIPYEPHLKDLARELRQRSTLAEILLWRELKGKRMLRYDFDRQKPIDHYILDFFCAKLKLAIEIDGESHWQIGEEDQKRQSRLEELGIRFLRFPDIMVKRDMKNVLSSIQAWIEENAEKPPSRRDRKTSTHP